MKACVEEFFGVSLLAFCGVFLDTNSSPFPSEAVIYFSLLLDYFFGLVFVQVFVWFLV